MSAPDSNKKLSFGEDFMRRLREVKTSRWVRFSIVSLVFLLWVVWMGNPWLLLVWLLLFDIYITGYIPWTWWKKRKPGAVRTVMGWLDAIIYALVLVYFIFAFIGQNYKIPSSSLEKSLLVGDYLWVNKTVYGPRVPMTPVHFPLTQHTLPGGIKSYLEKPQLAYHRLPGLRSISRGDIVVFNFPNGDTVLTKMEVPDYYQICYDLRNRGVTDPKDYLIANRATYGDLVWRPVDRRENYVKRAIGLPGDRLAIKGDTVYINGQPMAEPTEVQHNYIIPVSAPIPEDQWLEIGVRLEDRGTAPIDGRDALGFQFYDVPLTASMKAQVEKWPQVSGPLRRETETGWFDVSGVFPLGASYGWTRPDMGEFWVPKRGVTLHLTQENLPLYERIIRTYEGNDLQVRDGKIYINGEQTDYYTFQMDYYWMMGDNRDRSLDSRYWGFVPEDHIVGSPGLVLISFDEERSLLDGKIRFNRILRSANPDAGKWD